jgi:hypothetical protein
MFYCIAKLFFCFTGFGINKRHERNESHTLENSKLSFKIVVLEFESENGKKFLDLNPNPKKMNSDQQHCREYVP